LRDDAAILRPDPGTDLVLSADAVVAGIHFPAETPPDTIARRAMRVNLSDLAAKGARPRGYTLVLQLPEIVDESWLSAFAGGLAAEQDEFAVTLLGGDTTCTPGPLAITINMIGQVSKNKMIKRSGAHEDDDVFVTGCIGDAMLGLACAMGRLTFDDPADAAVLESRFYHPDPRMNVGPALIGLASASADVSDGLIADLGHICVASGFAADIVEELVPLSATARSLTKDDLSLRTALLTGGDDYEIVFTAPVSARKAVSIVAVETGVPITRIGRISKRNREGPAVAVRNAAGDIVEVGHGGYRHFGNGVAG